MASDWEAITVLSSIVVRAASYIFLRWIPGHQAPPIIFASLIAYLVAFKNSLDRTPAYAVVADQTNTAFVDGNGKVLREEVDLKLADRDGELAAEVDAVTINDNENEDEQDEEDGSAAHDGNVDTIQSESLILGERPPHILRSLVSGLPSPTSVFWNVVTVLTHILPALMTADMVYRGPMFHPSFDLSFAKLGYVSDTTANLLIREPDISLLPLNVSIKELDALDGSDFGRAVNKSWKEVARISYVSNETDFTHPVEVTKLRSSRRYAFSVSNGHHGQFTTAPRPGRFQPDRQKFTFLSTSCIKAHFPYNPLDHPLTVPGFKYLASTLSVLKPAFMLFLGDWVYVDVPRRLGSDAETYRREYRQVYASPEWPAVNTIPWLHVIDDHEIANDWDKNTSDPFPAAINAFDIYHGSVNPPEPKDVAGATWRTFVQGPASFFLMDTRKYRVANTLPDGPAKTMLGDLQLHSLLRWLETPEPEGVHWKVVVSSIPFTRNWRVNAQDTWAGYLHERRIVLEKMWDVGAGPSGIGVVVLSGDRHEFAATSFPPPMTGKWPISATVHEFSASPLSMFYLPFRSYWEENDKAVAEGREEDICIKYIPDGNSKFGAIEIEREVGGEQSRLHYRLFVDGKETWSYGIMSPPRGRGPRGKDATWA